MCTLVHTMHVTISIKHFPISTLATLIYLLDYAEVSDFAVFKLCIRLIVMPASIWYIVHDSKLVTFTSNSTYSKY